MPDPASDRLPGQLQFLVAADALKLVDRASVLQDGSRLENTAEHAWHRALWVMVFADTDIAAPNLDLGRAIAMALIPELADHAGDALDLLPHDQARSLRRLLDDLAQEASPEARLLALVARAQPLFQELGDSLPSPADLDRLRGDLLTGRFAALRADWPELHGLAEGLLEGRRWSGSDDLVARLRFLADADRLKSVLRATPVMAGTRRENSAEHSWHICLFALILAEHGIAEIEVDRVLQMLVLHDLVEIDAGDVPIHGGQDPAAQEAKERAAADRLFGLLPKAQGAGFRTLWDEFETAQSDDAVFAKAVDRVQPVLTNLEAGGGTWPEYNVTLDQLERRVAGKVRRGAPAIWEALWPRIDAWFRANGGPKVSTPASEV